MTQKNPAGEVLVAGLGRDFPSGAGLLTVLDDLDLELAAGQSLSIVGPSGCGKSTLLHVLGTLDQPDRGSVRIGGNDPFALDDRALAAFRNRNIGFVFQDHHLLPQLTVGENVLLPTLAGHGAGEPGGAVEARAERLIERVGLSERLSHLPAELSGGERQRVAIARALVLRPGLLLCDEPTGNLDPQTADAVAELLLEVQREEGSTLVVVTHSSSLAARCERRGVMAQGRLELR